MICFLTSSPVTPEGALNPENGFVEELRACLPENCAALFICSDPDGHERTLRFAYTVQYVMEAAGLSFRSFAVLDGANEDDAAELVRDAELIVLGGGHTPTQNRFFRKIGLRELLKGYQGVVLGISAGSMNCAEVVYAQPEEPSEAIDPDYERFLPGLGLTKTMLLPHYQEVKDDVLDGLRVFEDVAYPDSMGRTFYALVDGSYLLIRDGKEELRGEAYRIENGILTQIAKTGGSVFL